MGSLKDVVVVIVGLAGLGYGVYKYFFGTTPYDNWIAIGCGVLFFVCGIIYFLGHVNKEEEIHITQ